MKHQFVGIAYFQTNTKPDRMSCSSFIDPIARKSKSCGNGRTRSQRCQCPKVIHVGFHGELGKFSQIFTWGIWNRSLPWLIYWICVKLWGNQFFLTHTHLKCKEWSEAEGFLNPLYLSIYRSIDLSIIYLSIYLPIYLPI